MLCAEGAVECGDASPHRTLAPPDKSKQGGPEAPTAKILRCFAALWARPCASTPAAQKRRTKAFSRDGNFRVPLETSSPLNAERRLPAKIFRRAGAPSMQYPIRGRAPAAIISWPVRGCAARAQAAYRDRSLFSRHYYPVQFHL